jgi:hypothetical protein
MSSLNPGFSSNSRTEIRPPSEVTRDPWKSTFNEALKRMFTSIACPHASALQCASRQGNTRLVTKSRLFKYA